MKKKKIIQFPAKMQDSDRMPLDPDRPMLEQFEEEVLNAPTHKEFARGLEWLDKNFYQNEQVRSLTNSMQSLTPTKDKS